MGWRACNWGDGLIKKWTDISFAHAALLAHGKTKAFPARTICFALPTSVGCYISSQHTALLAVREAIAFSTRTIRFTLPTSVGCDISSQYTALLAVREAIATAATIFCFSRSSYGQNCAGADQCNWSSGQDSSDVHWLEWCGEACLPSMHTLSSLFSFYSMTHVPSVCDLGHWGEACDTLLLPLHSSSFYLDRFKCDQWSKEMHRPAQAASGMLHRYSSRDVWVVISLPGRTCLSLIGAPDNIHKSPRIGFRLRDELI